ncbi:MAG: hypothetical protein IPJ75_16830 [Ignavibacteriales bacterium]|nr:hypothetical protein [Ignavibacteriales bacterium]
MIPELKTSNLSVIFLGTHVFGVYLLSGKRKSNTKSFTIYPLDDGDSHTIFPKLLPPGILKRIKNSNIVVIPDISLLTIGNNKDENISFSNDTIDDLYDFLFSMGVKNPVVISSLASIEILFHYYSKTLKFFPDDKTFILSGNDDIVFEARLRGRGLAAARLIDYDNFSTSTHSYDDCDHLITFSSDPYSFRFAEVLKGIDNPVVSCGHEENFLLSEHTEDGKSYKGIFNICEMVSDLYYTNTLPLPGLLTTEEQERASGHIKTRRVKTINLTVLVLTLFLLLYFVYALFDLISLNGAKSELDIYKMKNREQFELVNEFGGKVKLIPKSKLLVDSTRTKFVELSSFINIIENYTLDKNIQLTKISLQPNKYIYIRGYTDSPGVISTFLQKFKGSQLLSSESLQTGTEYFTAFKAIIPWGVK